mmetsp:Transcript_22200/g.46706  ORF Transcript_22200/g.46706 Transcript_22200/m.46706 type:complete len:94 (-) Transcript_22200:116-397(-)
MVALVVARADRQRCEATRRGNEDKQTLEAKAESNGAKAGGRASGAPPAGKHLTRRGAKRTRRREEKVDRSKLPHQHSTQSEIRHRLQTPIDAV